MGDYMSDQYVDALKHFDKLFALWSPDQETEIKPGSCGYFDSEGEWNAIADLCNPADAEKFHYGPALPKPKEKPLGKWDPVCSKNMKWSRVVLDAPVKYASRPHVPGPKLLIIIIITSIELERLADLVIRFATPDYHS
jgi:hypothetical protein